MNYQNRYAFTQYFGSSDSAGEGKVFPTRFSIIITCTITTL